MKYRSKAQFKKEIKERTLKERELMQYYVDWLNKLNTDKSSPYTFKDHGVDNSGEFVKGYIPCDADFILQRSGKRNRKIEIKSCGPEKKYFHLKVSQIIDYIQDDVCIVNFMGSDTENIRFCIIPPADLSEWLKHGERKTMWNQECIRFYTKDMDWHTL